MRFLLVCVGVLALASGCSGSGPKTFQLYGPERVVSGSTFCIEASSDRRVSTMNMWRGGAREGVELEKVTVTPPGLLTELPDDRGRLCYRGAAEGKATIQVRGKVKDASSEAHFAVTVARPDEVRFFLDTASGTSRGCSSNPTPVPGSRFFVMPGVKTLEARAFLAGAQLGGENVVLARAGEMKCGREKPREDGITVGGGCASTPTATGEYKIEPMDGSPSTMVVVDPAKVKLTARAQPLRRRAVPIMLEATHEGAPVPLTCSVVGTAKVETPETCQVRTDGKLEVKVNNPFHEVYPVGQGGECRLALRIEDGLLTKNKLSGTVSFRVPPAPAPEPNP